MCQIIYRPAGASGAVSWERANYCAAINRDGYGLMWAYRGKLITARYVWKDRRAFFLRMMALQKDDVPFAAHFRLATHGKSTKDNAHPYWIRKNESALMHNGMLDIECPPGWSDTRTFVDQVLRRLPDDWEAQPHLSYLVDQATVGSRMLIMHADERVTIFHRQRGVEEAGIWYANDGFRPHVYSSKEGSDVWARWASEGAKQGQYGLRGYKGSYTTSSVRYLPGTKSAKESAELFSDDATSTRVPADGPSPHLMGRHSKGTDPRQGVDQLFLWDNMLVCADCLRMETTAEKEAIPLTNITASDSCDLCDVRGRMNQRTIPQADGQE